MLRKNVDPIEHPNAQRAAARVNEQRGITLRAYADPYIGGKVSAWKSAIHRPHWRNTLRDYAYPQIGDLPIVIWTPKPS